MPHSGVESSRQRARHRRARGRRPARALAAALLLFLAGCGPRVEPAPIRNVVLVSIDTLRADHVSAYGYPRKTTPTIDALAGEGARFKLAIASNSSTLPSHATLFTGMLPPHHGVRDNDGYYLDESRLTLAEILRDEGFVTGAVIGAGVIASHTGMEQGFESFDEDFGFLIDHYPTRPAGEVSAAGVRFIEEHADEPLFLFLHYYDPHAMYAPPEPFRTRFADHLYAGEIAYADFTLASVIEKLRELDLYDSTLVIVTSDHGESLGEHGEETHAYFIYQVTQHVPLVIRAPGMPGGLAISGAVGIVDVVPTILGLLGIPAPEGLQGRDLSPLLRGEEPADPARGVYCESYHPTKLGCTPLLGLVSERWKYIHTARPELYDLKADPQERVNLFESEPERAAAMAARLEEIRADARPGTRRVLNSATAEQLSALGYLRGAVAEEAEISPDLRDPKDALGEYKMMQDVGGLAGAKMYDEARALGVELLRRRPDLIDVHRMLGNIAYDQRDWRRAISRYELYLRLWEAGVGFGPAVTKLARADVHHRLGHALAESGRPGRAEGHFRRSIELDPAFAGTHYLLGRALAEMGRGDEAEAEFREALRLDPDFPKAREALEGLREGARPSRGG